MRRVNLLRFGGAWSVKGGGREVELLPAAQKACSAQDLNTLPTRLCNALYGTV